MKVIIYCNVFTHYCQYLITTYEKKKKIIFFQFNVYETECYKGYIYFALLLIILIIVLFKLLLKYNLNDL